MQELRREFECQKCLQRVHVEADDWNGGGIGKPVICVGEVDGVACRGTKFSGKAIEGDEGKLKGITYDL